MGSCCYRVGRNPEFGHGTRVILVGCPVGRIPLISVIAPNSPVVPNPSGEHFEVRSRGTRFNQLEELINRCALCRQKNN